MNSDYRLEKRSAYRFSILSTLNMRCVAELYIKKFKLSTAGWRILSIIGRYEPVFPGVAAQLSTMDADKVTRAVDRLVEMDLVVRNTDAADRRRVILCLSSRGHAVYNEIESASQALEADLRSAVSAEEWAHFSAVLDKLELRAQVIFTKEAARERFAAPVRAAGKKGAAAASTDAAALGKTAAAPPAAKRNKPAVTKLTKLTKPAEPANAAKAARATTNATKATQAAKAAQATKAANAARPPARAPESPPTRKARGRS